MSRDKIREPDFPMASFLHVRQELGAIRNDLERDKAIWLATRTSLEERHLNALDEQFKTAFEQLGSSSSTLPTILHLLEELVQAGAAATLLGNYEWGAFGASG